MDELFKKVFNNKYIRMIIFKNVEKHLSYRYDEISSLSWIFSNHFFGLALDKLKYNRDGLSDRFGISNLYELLVQMDVMSASELLNYLLTEYDFNIINGEKEEINKKRNQFFTCLPALDYMTRTCNINDIKLMESVLSNDKLSNVTSTTALDNAPLNPSKTNRIEIVKYLLNNRSEGCSFRILINTIVSDDLELLKYLIENVKLFQESIEPNQVIIENQSRVLRDCIRNLNVEMLEYILNEFPKLGFNFTKINWFEMIRESLESVSVNDISNARIIHRDTLNKDKVLKTIKFIVENKITNSDRDSLINKFEFKESLLDSFLFSLLNSLTDIMDYLINESKLLTLPLDKHTISICKQFQWFYSISYESLIFCHINNVNIIECKSPLKLSLFDLKSVRYVEENGISNNFNLCCIEVVNHKIQQHLQSKVEKEDASNFILEYDDIDIDTILIECSSSGYLSTMIYLSQFVNRDCFTEELAQVALKEGQLDIIRFLFNFGIEIDLNHLLILSSALNNFNAVLMIFKEFQFEPNNINSNILEASCKPNCFEMLKYLYSILVKPSTATISISTLNQCIENKYWKIVNWLLDNIFPPLTTITDTTRIIDRGISNLSTVKKLIEHGFVFSKRSFNLSVGNVNILKYLTEMTQLKQECTSDAIDNASRFGYYNSVKYLLDNRKEGYKLAIQFSLTRGWFDIIELLSSKNEYKSLFKPNIAQRLPVYYNCVDQIIVSLNSPQMLEFIINENHPYKLPITGQQITNAIVKGGHLSIISILLEHINADKSVLTQCYNLSILYDRPIIANYLKNKLLLL